MHHVSKVLLLLGLIAISPSREDVSSFTLSAHDKLYRGVPDVADLRNLLDTNIVTSVDLVNYYSTRTSEVNHDLHAVGELNPDALAIARQLDAEAARGLRRRPLHGIPVLVKDNIATFDKLNTTSGSYALLGARVEEDAFVVKKLRDAGAIVLGKATMGEWAQFRSRREDSSHGWSAYGGQCHGIFHAMQDPSGSSSGSAVAVSAGLVPLALGTETFGSIVLPSEKNNIVGIKPTLGLTSRDLVIPISARQDVVGPMANTVRDAALMLSVIAGRDSKDNYTSSQPFNTIPRYEDACDENGLNGARLGVPWQLVYELEQEFPMTSQIISTFKSTLLSIQQEGALINQDLRMARLNFTQLYSNAAIVLDSDFEAGLHDYFQRLSHNPHNISTLTDVLEFTKRDPREEFDHRGAAVWTSHSVSNTEAQRITSLSAESVLAGEQNKILAGQGIVSLLEAHRLDALIMPTITAFKLSDMAGLPVITVPMGFYGRKTALHRNAKKSMYDVAPGIPFGLSFVGRAWSEETLIRLAYAFEQMGDGVKGRARPVIKAKTTLLDVLVRRGS